MPGTRRHLKRLATDALIIVSQRGKPSLFITATTNVEWSEIQEKLLSGQTAYDRPDIVAMVFHQRLQAFLHNIRSGVYFGEKRVTYEMYVIEYQHRGLPHAHIVVQLEGLRDLRPEEQSEWIDASISARMPSRDDDPELLELVKKFMVHKCSTDVNGCLDKDGQCRKHFDRNIPNEKTTFDSKGFPMYKRDQDSLYVVTYVPQILKDWGGHCNVGFCGSVYTCVYLYKYVFKGAKKERFRLKNAEDIDDQDEINLYLRGRMICSMDACWRVFGYHTYPRSNPTVNVVQVKMPQHMQYIADHGRVCDLAVYFNRPDTIEMNELKFTEFSERFAYSCKLPKRYERNREMDGVEYWEIHFNGLKRFVYKRFNKTPVIARMGFISVQAGEKYFLRLLMLNYAARSHADLLKCPDGTTVTTFQQAARARGIIRNGEEPYQVFTEIRLLSTPEELRSLFILFTKEGFPTIQIYMDVQMRDAMKADYITNYGPDDDNVEARSTNDLLKDLAARLGEENKKLSDYGLPEPTDVQTELDQERMKYSREGQALLLQELQRVQPNNEQQDRIFEMVTEAIARDETLIVFLNGVGGSGKTTLVKKLMAFTRSLGKIALGCASTGLAATNFEDFFTAHALFKYPVNDDRELDDEDYFVECKLKAHPQRKELLDAASFLAWDEFPSNDKNIVQAAFRALDGLKGKVFVASGDFRQIAPIVRRGTIRDTYAACIKSSYLWDRFVVCELTTNMRLEVLLQDMHRQLAALNSADCSESPHIRAMKIADISKSTEKQLNYARMIVSIGDGKEKIDPSINVIADRDASTGEAIIQLPGVKYFADDPDGIQRKKAIEWIFPQGYDTPGFHERAIIAGMTYMCRSTRTKLILLQPRMNE